jgi:tetratricopeptide (TPR) repeat protein
VNIEAAFARGDWPAVRALCDRHENLLVTLTHRVRLEYEVGDFSQGQAWLERLLESGQTLSPGTTSLAFCALGVLEIARIADVADRFGIAETLARGVLSSRPIPRFTMLARTALALMAVQRGEAEAAAEQYATLEPLRGTVLPHSLIIMDRVLGLTSQTMGNLDQAMAHFEDALAFCRKAGYRPELAWSCCDYADVLLNPVGAALRGRPGHPPRLVGAPTDPADRRKAMALLDEALAISRELGMRPLMERVLSRREILTA